MRLRSMISVKHWTGRSGKLMSIDQANNAGPQEAISQEIKADYFLPSPPDDKKITPKGRSMIPFP